MKAFSFFSGKGGVGKTTLTIMLASYLAFVLDLKVLVIDMERPDGRIMPFRQLELMQLQTVGTPLNNYAKAHQMPNPAQYYEIEEFGMAVEEYSPERVRDIVDKIKRAKEQGPWDVMLLDFPASYSDHLPVHVLAEERVLDGVYALSRLEQQDRRSACITTIGISSCGVKTKIVWNDIDADVIKRGRPLDLAEGDTAFLAKYGVSYSRVRIKHFRKATQTSEQQCFVRSTICWPDQYVRMWCPEIINLFTEIINELNI